MTVHVKGHLQNEEKESVAACKHSKDDMKPKNSVKSKLIVQKDSNTSNVLIPDRSTKQPNVDQIIPAALVTTEATQSRPSADDTFEDNHRQNHFHSNRTFDKKVKLQRNQETHYIQKIL